MKIRHLELYNFRSYERAAFDFCDGVNMITGENGAGKTNILEALYLLCGSRSWRCAKNAEMIRFGSPSAVITADIANRSRDFHTVLELKRNGRGTVKINGVAVRKKSAMSESVRCVIFSPSDLFLIKGASSKRREFLDNALCQIKPAYAEALSRYERTLASKNKLLKDGGELSVLPEYNRQLAFYGAELIKTRAEYTESINSKAKEIHSEVSDKKEILCVKYSSVSVLKGDYSDKKIIENALFSHLCEMYPAEVSSQSCLTGAHKDDLEVFVNDREAKAFASQGQARTAAISLKFAERELLREDDEYPVLLLDDVMSELDKSRREYITKNAFGGQTVITTTEGTGADKVIELK